MNSHLQIQTKESNLEAENIFKFSIAGLVFAVLLSWGMVASAADWSDTFVGYRVGNKFQEPCCADIDIHKDIFSFTHVSGYKYGMNFFTADFLISDEKDPVAGGGGGAQEVYAVYRHLLSLSAVTKTSMTFGPIKDIGFTIGADLNSKNDAFAPRVQKFVIGPTLKFKVPGFFDISLFYRTEKNHNGIVNRDVNFDPTYGVSMAWGIPIKAINSKFDGFIDHIGPKGLDGFGFDTKAETLARLFLMYDIGSLAGKAGTFYLGAGYEYWNNKFGGNPFNNGKTSAPMLAAEAHF